eukprot:CAMPEP_0202820948 /NCGR_PEP_ID=MMETSP1389-20130828/10082_1 /ASSEMBLY_ACC=CAM_ASM_000865 /TAXON_ID=302021 /ORGANISM="Rhodomonas sp., Strain CCMP768" /LENGTH=75 /DNA_ID=CAMNT_0049493669 /DNA_START=200 /DNA_END=427 /DNA_ORIENTATION=-
MPPRRMPWVHPALGTAMQGRRPGVEVRQLPVHRQGVRAIRGLKVGGSTNLGTVVAALDVMHALPEALPPSVDMSK